MRPPATLLHSVSPITGIVAHNRRGYGRLSHITEARSAWPSDRRLTKRAQRLLPRGWRLLSEPSYCRHNAGLSEMGKSPVDGRFCSCLQVYPLCHPAPATSRAADREEAADELRLGCSSRLHVDQYHACC